MITAQSLRMVVSVCATAFICALSLSLGPIARAEWDELQIIGNTPEPQNLPAVPDNPLRPNQTPAGAHPETLQSPTNESGAIESDVHEPESPSISINQLRSTEFLSSQQQTAPKKMRYNPASAVPLSSDSDHDDSRPSYDSLPELPPPTAETSAIRVLENHVLNEQQIRAMLDGETVILNDSDAHFRPNFLSSDSSEMIVGGNSYLDSTGDCPQWVCDRVHRFWIRGEAMALWLRGDQLPALVTRSPAGTPQADAGQIGLPTTQVLFGGNRPDQDARLGARVNMGKWLKYADTIAVEAEVMYMQEGDDHHRFASTGIPALARPFFNVDPGVAGEDADLVAFDGLISGELVIDTRAELYSGSLGMRWISMHFSNPCQGLRTEWISGFRYLRIAELLSITDNRTALANHNTLYGALAAGDTFTALDRFKSSNDFYGYNMGINSHLTRGRFSLQALAKVALGVNHQLVDIGGSRTITPVAGAATTTRSGLLTSGNMAGQHARSRFAVVPQASITGGFYLTPMLRATIGYQFMLLSDAVRPGLQIDRNINGTLLDAAIPDSGPTRPQFPFASESIFLHAATAGLEFAF